MYMLNVIKPEIIFNHYKHGWFILFSYQEKGKLGNYLLAIAKHFTHKNQLSDEKISINAFISMFSSLVKIRVAVYVVQLAKKK